MTTVEAVGLGGTVTFDGQMLRIVRSGFFARSTIGKGEKAIPVRSIGSVNFKPATRLNNGFVEFSIVGGVETQSRAGSQYLDAAKNENAVVFRFRENEQFARLKDALEAALNGQALTDNYWNR